jgi:hypothetical protein
VAATSATIDRIEKAFGLKPKRLTADTAYGTGKLLAWLLGKDITPHIPVHHRLYQQHRPGAELYSLTRLDLAWRRARTRPYAHQRL